YLSFFSLNSSTTTDIYTLSLHDALPISVQLMILPASLPVCNEPKDSAMLMKPLRQLAPTWTDCLPVSRRYARFSRRTSSFWMGRSEEHTSELQSLAYLVCRLLLEKKKKK